MEPYNGLFFKKSRFCKQCGKSKIFVDFDGVVTPSKFETKFIIGLASIAVSMILSFIFAVLAIWFILISNYPKDKAAIYFFVLSIALLPMLVVGLPLSIWGTLSKYKAIHQYLERLTRDLLPTDLSILPNIDPERDGSRLRGFRIKNQEGMNVLRTMKHYEEIIPSHEELIPFNAKSQADPMREQVKNLLTELLQETDLTRELLKRFNPFKIQGHIIKLEGISDDISYFIRWLNQASFQEKSLDEGLEDLKKLRMKVSILHVGYANLIRKLDVHLPLPPSFKHEFLPGEEIKYTFEGSRFASAFYDGIIVITNKRMLFDMKKPIVYYITVIISLGVPLLLLLIYGKPKDIIELSTIYEARPRINFRNKEYRIIYSPVKFDKNGKVVIQNGRPKKGRRENIMLRCSRKEYLRDIEKRVQEICDAINVMKAKE